jgi:hypothetical protein
MKKSALPQWRSLRWAELFLAVVVIVYAASAMDRFDAGLAKLHTDDGPLLYAIALKDPSLFAGDYQIGMPIEERVNVAVKVTAMNWIPALSWKYLHIPPYPTIWLITLWQVLSIGLGVYLLSLTVTRNRWVSGLAVIFAYSTALWGWDPANYGTGSSWNFIPYAAYLSFAPVLLAFVCLLRGREITMLALLACAGLFHPNIALYACAIVGVASIAQRIQDSEFRLLPRMAGLFAAGAVVVAPGVAVLLSQRGIDTNVSHDELMAGFRVNQHLWPWGMSGRWFLSVPTACKWLVLALLSWRHRDSLIPGFGRLWLSAVAVFAVLGCSHIVGAWLEIPLLLNLTGLRSFGLLAFITLPLVMQYWDAHLRSGNWLSSVLVLLCLAFTFYAYEYALFWPMIGLLAMQDLLQGHFIIWKPRLPPWGRSIVWTLSLVGMAAWAVVFLRLPSGTAPVMTSFGEAFFAWRWQVFGSLPSPRHRLVLGIAIAAAAFAMRWYVRRCGDSRTQNTKWFSTSTVAVTTMVLTVYASGFVVQQWKRAIGVRQSSAIQILDVQLWAKEHSPRSSVFVVPESGWRTMSQRRQFDPFTCESYAYVVKQESLEYRNRLLRFYGITEEEGRRLRGISIFRKEYERFNAFTERDYLRFASEFGATHLVLSHDERTQSFSLPRVYENSGYLVFRLAPKTQGQSQRAPSETIERR